jgi:alpha-methylacyl-CoA racemase
MQAVMAILAALVARQRSGTGTWLDVSVTDGALGLMALTVDEQLATGVPQHARSGLLTGRYACYDVYRAADGKWLTVAAIEPKFWANLCRLLDLERWIEHQTDDAAQDAIRADLGRVFATRDRDTWVAELAPADTCVAAVATVDEVVSDPHYAARSSFVDVHSVGHGSFRQVGRVFAGMQRHSIHEAVEARDPVVTEIDSVLGDAGYTPDEIAKLRDAGVIA